MFEGKQMPRIGDALGEFADVVRQEADGLVPDDLREAAIAMCRADHCKPFEICVGYKHHHVLVHNGVGRFVVCEPIWPAWMDYVTLAKAALDAQDR